MQKQNFCSISVKFKNCFAEAGYSVKQRRLLIFVRKVVLLLVKI